MASRCCAQTMLEGAACWICMEGGHVHSEPGPAASDGTMDTAAAAASSEQLISPCRCSGSVGYVHVRCIEQWRSKSQARICERCRTPYSVTGEPPRLIRAAMQWLEGPMFYAPLLLCTFFMYPVLTHVVRALFCAAGFLRMLAGTPPEVALRVAMVGYESREMATFWTVVVTTLVLHKAANYVHYVGTWRGRVISMPRRQAPP